MSIDHLELNGVTYEVGGSGGGLSDEAKQALLACFQNVAWIDEDGQDYYDALETALNLKELVSISATFNQTGVVIYDTYTLDALKNYLTVKAYYNDGTQATVQSYALSGSLESGTSTITASYNGKTATFNVTVSSRIPSEYRQVEYIQSNGTQVIVTDIIPRDTRTIVTFEFVDFIANKDNFITGVWNANDQRYYAAWITSSGRFEVHNRSNATKWTGPTNPTGKHTVDFNNASHQMLYDGEVKATDSTFAITSGDGELAIFDRGGDNEFTNFVSKAKIYSLKYEDNTTGNAVGEFIPCYRKSDNVVGMYDLVSEQFYVDYLSGDPFIKGSTAWETPE